MGRPQMILEHSAKLRLLTVFLFYFTQGVPIGLFAYAIPAWLASNGASTAAVAGVLAATVLPWTLKFFVGFVMDRYTYLAMGRRRIWIITSQSTIVAILLLGAVFSPDASEIWLISAFGFLSNAGTAFQDVAIDSLAVDIMPEDERGKAAGIMFGAQTLGIAGCTFAASQLIAHYGVAAGYLVAAGVVGCVLVFGICVREREGEKRFPWSQGTAHPRNIALQIDAWKPLLIQSGKAMITPASLLAAFVILAHSALPGIAEAYHPSLATGTAGWAQTEYTNTISGAQLASGLFVMIIGGWSVSKIGAQRATLIGSVIAVCSLAGFGLLAGVWDNHTLLTVFFWEIEFIRVLLMVSIVPIAMRLCDPAVAATQFTIFMAAGNFGRPIGNAIAASADEVGNPQMMYFIVAGIFAVTCIILMTVRLRRTERIPLHSGQELAPV